MLFYERLKTTRIEKGFTQKQLASAIGVSERVFQNYEAAVNEPKISKLLDLANTLEVSADYLLGRTDNPEINQ